FDSDDPSPTQGDDTAPDPAEGVNLDIIETGDVAGSAGNDTISISAVLSDLSVDAGTGDDTVTVGDGAFLDTSTIAAGDGEDAINFTGEVSSISGGAGDDTITADFARGTTITGGTGDDVITGVSTLSDAVVIDGGDGNDTLSSLGTDGTYSDNARLIGGAGDDVIVAAGLGSAGAAYDIIADGGAGNDTITLATGPVTDDGLLFNVPPISATGGDGTDDFLFVTEMGISQAPDQTSASFRDGVATVFLGAIPDFDPATETLSIDADAAAGAGLLTTATLQSATSNSGDPITELTLSYENNGAATVQVLITLGSDSVTWDDIAFVGTQTPQLTPLAVT
ncbi:MAG: hypothetical protein AAFN94_15055, partial [Pseudomonadota bacterium]